MEHHLIEIQGLKKTFQGVPVLRGVDLCVDPGRMTVLIGPSGCGNSPGDQRFHRASQRFLAGLGDHDGRTDKSLQSARQHSL